MGQADGPEGRSGCRIGVHPYGSTPKVFRTGTYRSVAPETTVARVRDLAPALGITRVADLTGLDTIGIPVVVVCRPNARSLAVSQGKGPTLAAAQASGLMEAAELWHAERITLPVKLASYNELRFTHTIADVASLPRLSTGAFHADRRLLWIEGVDLLLERPVWLPYEVVHADYTLPFPTGSGCFVASSNGLASGNNLVEAVIHGICEVVERDATTLWHTGGWSAGRGRRIDAATVDDPTCVEVLGRYEAAGVAAAVWETTSDLGVPSFLCAIADRRPCAWRHLPVSFGAGCHPSRAVALSRALTEAAQDRLTLIAGSRDDIRRSEYEPPRGSDARDAILALAQEGAAGGRSFTEVPTFEGATLEEDLAWLVGRLRTAKIPQAVVVDLTQGGLGLAVARVVIPGLEAPDDAPGYTPGPRARAAMASS